MFFNDYKTFFYILSFALVYNVIKFIWSGEWSRNVTLVLGNVLILSTFIDDHTLIVLAVLSLLVYLCGRSLQKHASSSTLFWILLFVLSLFVIRNYFFIQVFLSKSILSFVTTPIVSVQKIGLSYILFRYIHWLVESYKQNIPTSNFLTFLNYIFFFPSILAGPIDTYSNFQFWIKNRRFQYHKSLFLAGITRILIGAFKTLGIVPFVIAYATDYTLFLPDYTPLVAIAISLLAYSAYIYLDFSGYSDIAIGSAYLLGIKTPENFNSPYIAKNLSDFWKRWHITFSTFLKWYVFKPCIHLLNRLVPTSNRLVITVLGYLITFIICGLWHGDKINFVYWGLWHGIGLALNKIWTTFLKPHFNFTNTSVYTLSSILFTFLYVTVGWVFFHYSTSELVQLFHLIYNDVKGLL